MLPAWFNFREFTFIETNLNKSLQVIDITTKTRTARVTKPYRVSLQLKDTLCLPQAECMNITVITIIKLLSMCMN